MQEEIFIKQLIIDLGGVSVKKYVTTVIKAILLLVITNATAQTARSPYLPAQTAGDTFATKWCSTTVGSPPKTEGSDLIGYFENSVSAFLARKDYTILRTMINEVNNPKCLYADGLPRLGSIHNGFTRFFTDVADWAKKREVVEEVKKAMPNEPLSALLEAEYWRAYAWDARGSGYASAVSADGWKLFGERLAMAEKVLLTSKQYASSNPIWYEEMLIVKSASSASHRERETVFLEGIEKHGWYLPLYFTMENFLLPWWGGNWDIIDNMAAWSVQKTKSNMGETIYARLYWAAAGNGQKVNNVFKDTKATWPKMKRGFDDLIKQFPDSRRNLNAYARFACDADDRQTYNKLRKQIANAIFEDVWDAKRRHEVCDAKFGYKS